MFAGKGVAVYSTLIQRIDVKSTLNRRCFNVVCLLEVVLDIFWKVIFGLVLYALHRSKFANFKHDLLQNLMRKRFYSGLWFKTFEYFHNSPQYKWLKKEKVDRVGSLDVDFKQAPLVQIF